MLAIVVGAGRIPPVAVPFLVAYVSASFIGLWFLRRGFVRQTGLVYCTTLWLLLVTGDLVLGHPDIAMIASLYNVLMLAAFVVNGSAALGFGLAAVAWIGTEFWLRSVGQLPAPVAVLRPVDEVLQTSLPVLTTAIMAGYGVRQLEQIIARAVAGERSQARLVDSNRTLAELGERILRIESKPEFAKNVAIELQRVAGANAVAVYAAGATILERIGAVGTETPRSLRYELPARTAAEPTKTAQVHLLPAADTGLSMPGWVVWTGDPGYATGAILLVRERPLESHDEVLLVGCAALLAAALSRVDTEEQLRHTQKIETVGQLTSVVAHDFNNALMSIIGGTQIVLHDTTDPQLREILCDVIRAGEHAALLTKRLMSFSRRQKPELKLLELRQFVRDFAGLVKRLVGRDVDFSIGCQGPAVWIEADPNSLEQIILNLVLNARDAIHGRGKVSVEVEVEPQSKSAVLSVRDDGVGMVDSVRARVFEPFFTTKPVGKGTGLGLVAVRSAADALGASIEVISQPGVGSEFRVKLPLADTAAVDTTKRDEQAAEAHGLETILLVDDHEHVRQALARMLKHAGFDVVQAQDGVDALEVLASGVKPAAILSDIVMPRMSGLDLVRVLAERGVQLPIVLATGHAELGTERFAPWMQGIPILNKPMTPEALTTALRNAIDSSGLIPARGIASAAAVRHE